MGALEIKAVKSKMLQLELHCLKLLMTELAKPISEPKYKG
jgi:hypothetical protein